MIAMRKIQAFGYSGYGSTSKAIRRACEESQITWSLRERAQQKRGPRAAWVNRADRPAVNSGKGGQRKMEGQPKYIDATENEADRRVDAASGRCP